MTFLGECVESLDRLAREYNTEKMSLNEVLKQVQRY